MALLPLPHVRTAKVFRELHMECYAVHAEVSAAMWSLVELLYRLCFTASLFASGFTQISEQAAFEDLQTLYLNIPDNLLPFVETNLYPFASFCM